MKIPEFEVKKLVANAAARAMGLPAYDKIMSMYGDCKRNIREDTEGFQKAFNAFYKIRRGGNWRKKFYEIFQGIRIGHKWSYSEVLKELSKVKTKSGQTFVDASFVSKMFATAYPDCPIIDDLVLKCIEERLSDGSQEEKINHAVSIYEQLKIRVMEFLDTKNGRSVIRQFDEMFPEYKHISDVKKMDCLMWQHGIDISQRF